MFVMFSRALSIGILFYIYADVTRVLSASADN